MEYVYIILAGNETYCTHVFRFSLGEGYCHGQNLGTEVRFETEFFSDAYCYNVNLDMSFGFHKSHVLSLLSKEINASH